MPWSHLGRPRGREQLRLDARGPRHSGPSPIAGRRRTRRGGAHAGPPAGPIARRHHLLDAGGPRRPGMLLDGRQCRTIRRAATSSVEPTRPAPRPSTRPPMLGNSRRRGWPSSSASATATWAVIGQQTVLTDLAPNGGVLNYDQWDGYARPGALLPVAASGRRSRAHRRHPPRRRLRLRSRHRARKKRQRVPSATSCRATMWVYERAAIDAANARRGHPAARSARGIIRTAPRRRARRYRNAIRRAVQLRLTRPRVLEGPNENSRVRTDVPDHRRRRGL